MDKIGTETISQINYESSLWSFEKIWPSFFSLLLSPIKDVSFEGMKHMKIIMFQWSSDAKQLLRNDSEELLYVRTLEFLNSGCLRTKCNMEKVLCKMKNCNLKPQYIINVISWWGKKHYMRLQIILLIVLIKKMRTNCYRAEFLSTWGKKVISSLRDTGL